MTRERGNAIGPATRVVADRVARLRKERGLALEDLSTQLGAIGWPLNRSSLSKIERGERRLDVDDLIALSIVLNVAPELLIRTKQTHERIPGLSSKSQATYEKAFGVGRAHSGEADINVRELTDTEMQAWLDGRVELLDPSHLVTFWKDARQQLEDMYPTDAPPSQATLDVQKFVGPLLDEARERERFWSARYDEKG